MCSLGVAQSIDTEKPLNASEAASVPSWGTLGALVIFWQRSRPSLLWVTIFLGWAADNFASQ